MGRFSSFLKNWANFWQTNLFWYEKHCSVIVRCPWKTDFFHTLLILKMKYRSTKQLLHTNVFHVKQVHQPKIHMKITQKVIYMYAFVHKIIQFLSQLRGNEETCIDYLHGLLEITVDFKVNVIHFRLQAP